MAWYLNPALTRFRNEVNSRWPRRDKTSDGTIGDLAHQATNSDHNPDPDGSVDAWDMDVDGVDVQKVIAVALKHESVQYVIHNRRITSRNQAGGLGTWHPYTGASPHTEHVHFNTRPSHERSTKPWFTTNVKPLPLEEDMTPAEFSAILNDPTVKAQMRAIGWTYPVTPTASMLSKMVALFDKVDVLAAAAVDDDADREVIKTQLAEVDAKVEAAGDVDEAEVAATVLAGLTPAAIADAVVAALPPDLAKDLADELAARLAS